MCIRDSTDDEGCRTTKSITTYVNANPEVSIEFTSDDLENLPIVETNFELEANPVFNELGAELQNITWCFNPPVMQGFPPLVVANIEDDLNPNLLFHDKTELVTVTAKLEDSKSCRAEAILQLDFRGLDDCQITPTSHEGFFCVDDSISQEFSFRPSNVGQGLLWVSYEVTQGLSLIHI